MTSPPFGDQRPPDNPEPDPALAGFPPPQPLAPGPYAPQPYAPYGPLPSGLTAPAAQGLAYPVPAPAPLSALPTEPRPYHQMLRGPLFRWWKPVLTLLLAVALYIPLVVLSLVPLIVVGVASGASDLGLLGFDVKNLSPTGFVVVNLSLIAMIPVSGLSIWIVHLIRPRYLSSVVGGIRWRWLARCVLIVLPLWLAYLALGLLVVPPDPARPAQWLPLLIIVLTMTPFQAAGEEYLFRGWLMQNIGAYFSRPILGLVVSVAVSAVAFAAAHGSRDPWIFGSIGCMAIAACVAVYRTGGLEAAIAMHAVNNVLAFGAVLMFGGWNEAFVGADTQGTPAVLVLAILVQGGALALILWQARRHGIQSRYRPHVVSAELAYSNDPR
ncbi:MAG TPA: type II CAAX endopeptidase family protein [Propionibacteriaceae bacterium]|nr:type II CAAX endopeptidase family protein [Propionibacteriaceae bacterium]